MPTLLFDYDGTLHDSLGIYAPAFRRVYAWLVANGHAPLRNFSDEEIGKWLGWSVKEMWDTFMPDLSEDDKVACSNFVGRNMIWGISNGAAALYPGAEDVLAGLRDSGHTLVFLSNCKHNYMMAHREAFDLDRYFARFYCAEDYGWEPKPKIFEHIREDFGADAEYVTIGDRFHDIELAASGHMPSIGCLYGFGTPEELASATITVDDVRQIPQALSEIL